jgi:hypothetical protein
MNSSQLLKIRTRPMNCGPCAITPSNCEPMNVTIGPCPCPNSDTNSNCGIAVISRTICQTCIPCKTNPPPLPIG